MKDTNKLTIEYIPVAEIIPYAKNPRKNDKAVDLVANSIQEFGFKNPLILDKNNEIITGHTRLKAAIKLGLTEVPVMWAEDLSPEQVKAYRILDNKSSELADWDENLLESEFRALEEKGFDLSLTGFSDKEIGDIWDDFEETKEDDFEVPKEAKYKITPGQVIELGNHRLMCGDSTKETDVDKLMNKNEINLLLTDPPYGINVVGDNGLIAKGVLAKEGTYKKVLGDESYFDITFLLKLGETQIIFGANYFHDVLPLNTKWLVWDKDRPVGTTFGDCELIWTNQKGIAIKKYKCTWNGMVREGESGTRVHPTQKPIKLLMDIIKDFSKDKDLILDLFGGSGSTLIACEQLNRKCFMMEIDPFYCSVIIERWEKLTGKTHTSISSGKKEKDELPDY